MSIDALHKLAGESKDSESTINQKSYSFLFEQSDYKIKTTSLMLKSEISDAHTPEVIQRSSDQPIQLSSVRVPNVQPPLNISNVTRSNTNLLPSALKNRIARESGERLSKRKIHQRT